MIKMMQTAKALNKNNLLQLMLVGVFGLGVLCYIIYKASHTSFTHDESYTYTHYVHQGFMDIISYKTPYTNNHILNTVLMKYSEVFFGSSEIALRLPNIFAFVLYSIFSVLLFYKYTPKLILPFYVLMVLNPYLLDFFALARGYGLSIAFMVMSVYYLMCYFTSKHNKHLVLFNIAAFLAVMSNFSLLNYYVAALIVYNAMAFIIHKNEYHFYRSNKINIVSFIISGMVLYEPLRRISKMSLLDFGGKNGFLEDTVSSVIYGFFYEMYVSPFYETILKVVVLLIVGFIVIIIIKNCIQKKEAFFKTNTALVIINLILLAIVFITMAQHVILGNDYYIHRFALFFYPLFILNVVFLLHYFITSYKVIIVSIAYVCFALALFNFYFNHTTFWYKDWKNDYSTKLVMQKIIIEHKKNSNKKMRLGINWLFEPSVNFYRYTWDLKWLNPAHRKGVSKYDNYILLFKTDKEFELFANKPLLFADELTGTVLLKNTD